MEKPPPPLIMLKGVLEAGFTVPSSVSVPRLVIIKLRLSGLLFRLKLIDLKRSRSGLTLSLEKELRSLAAYSASF